MTSKQIGRPKTEYPLEMIKDIIHRFTKEKKVTGKIKYMDVYRFSNDLYEKGEIEYKIGEYFWRKGKGRDQIDKTNEVLMIQIPSTEESETVVDTLDAINKYFNGKPSYKEKLIGSLSINERKLKKYIEKLNKAEKKLLEANQLIAKQQETIQSLKEKNILYEEKLFQWLELSINKKIPLYNLGTTGKTRTPIAEELLTSIFSDSPYETFEKIKSSKDLESTHKKKNIIPLQEEPRSVLDDFDF